MKTFRVVSAFRCLPVIAGLVAVASLNVRAATISWFTPKTIAGDSDVNTVGTLLGAYAPGTTNSIGPINGVTFTGWKTVTTGDGKVSTSFISSSTAYANGAGGTAPFKNLSANYQALLTDGLFMDGNSPQTLTLNSLTVGQRYLVQYWVNESRGSCCTSRTEGLDGQVTLDYNNTQASGGVGQYAIGIFTADATNQDINVSPSDSAQINALQIRLLPAPGPISWAAPATISSDADVDTDGTLVGAYAPGSGSDVGPVNGVTFTSWTTATSADGNVTTGFPDISTAYANGADGNAPFADLSASYQALLADGLYVDTNGLQTLTLKNLAVGANYLIQFWVNDSRGFCCTTRTEGLDSQIFLAFNNSLASGGVGQYAIGTFTAGATTQTINVTPSDSAQINALQVRLLSASLQPRLQSQLNGDGTVTISWDATYAGFTLEESSDFTTWTTNGTAQVINGSNLTVTITPAAPDKFYRLVQ